MTTGAFEFLGAYEWKQKPRIVPWPPFGCRSGQAFSKSVKSGAPQFIEISVKDRRNNIVHSDVGQAIGRIPRFENRETLRQAQGLWGTGLLLLFEYCLDISRAVENANDLDAPINRPIEDHVTANRNAM